MPRTAGRTGQQYGRVVRRPCKLGQVGRLPQEDTRLHQGRLQRSFLPGRSVRTDDDVHLYGYVAARWHHTRLRHVLRVLGLYETCHENGGTDGGAHKVHLVARCLPRRRRRPHTPAHRAGGAGASAGEDEEPQRQELRARAPSGRCRRGDGGMEDGNGEHGHADGTDILTADGGEPARGQRQRRRAQGCIHREGL